MYIMRPFLAASSSLSSTSLCAHIPRRLVRFSLPPLQPQLRHFTSKKTIHKQTHPTRQPSKKGKGINMSQSIYIDETPADVKNAKVELHCVLSLLASCGYVMRLTVTHGIGPPLGDPKHPQRPKGPDLA
jgi:BRCT domain type II-containing protein